MRQVHAAERDGGLPFPPAAKSVSMGRSSAAPIRAASWSFRNAVCFPGSRSKATSDSACRSFPARNAQSASRTTCKWSACRVSRHSYPPDLSGGMKQRSASSACPGRQSRHPFSRRAFRRARLHHPHGHARRAVAHLASGAARLSLCHPRHRRGRATCRPRRGPERASRRIQRSSHRYPPSAQYQLAALSSCATICSTDWIGLQDMSAFAEPRRWEGHLAAARRCACFSPVALRRRVDRNEVFPSPLKSRRASPSDASRQALLGRYL